MTKDTNGFFGCVSCKVQGVAVRPKEPGGHRMTYPTVGEDQVDAEFRTADSRFGHRGVSPLTRLLNVDLARDCPIEPMHLITNVVRRLVGKLLQRQNLEPGVTVDELYDAVAEASSNLPSSCFPRKIKSLRGHAQWKATECRQFIICPHTPRFQPLLNYFCLDY